MLSYRPAVALGALVMLCASSANGVVAQFNYGDVLVSDFGADHVQQFSSSGTLIRTFVGSGSETLGTLVAPGGNLFVACRNSSSSPHAGTVNIFSPDGTQTGSFAIPQITYAGDMTIFPDGTLALTDFSGPVQEYTQSGTFVRTVPVAGGYNTGDAVAANDGTLWVTGETSKVIYNFSEIGVLLRSFGVPFEPRDLVVANDGSLWMAPLFDSHIYHYSPSGAQLGTIATAISSIEGIALSPDQSTLYVSNENVSSVYRYSTSGASLGSFAIPGAINPAFLNTVTPEPSTLSMLSLFVFLPRRRRRRSFAEACT